MLPSCTEKPLGAQQSYCQIHINMSGYGSPMLPHAWEKEAGYTEVEAAQYVHLGHLSSGP